MDRLVEPLLHASSREHINRFITTPSHAVVLYGPEGAGTGFTAQYVASRLSAHSSDHTVIEMVNNSIGLDAIRPLYALTKTIRTVPRVVIIDDADTMTREAQNALLKLLEEPPKNVYFILTAHRLNGLLETIQSRVAQIELLPVDVDASQGFITSLGASDDSTARQLLFLARGLPAELHRLSTDKEYRDAQIELMTTARKLIELDTYSRLVMLKQHMTDRSAALSIVSMLERLLQFMLLKDASPHLMQMADAVITAKSRLIQNGNTRAQLLWLSERLG